MIVSVIIPTYNRIKYLPLALESLALQNFAKDEFEVIVIDDGSREDCQSVIDSFKDKLDLQLIKLNHGGVCKARNAGVKIAKSDILAFFDDDAVADPNWLQAIVESMKSENMLVGRVKPLNRPFWGYFAPHYDRGEAMKPANSLLEGNCAIKRSVFDKVGLFDENIDYGHEGQEFLNRAQKFFVLTYCPTMVIYHDYAFGLADYLGKQFKFGEKSAYLKIKNGENKIVGVKEKNEVLEKLPVMKKITIKLIARLGYFFHVWGFLSGQKKYK